MSGEPGGYGRRKERLQRPKRKVLPHARPGPNQAVDLEIEHHLAERTERLIEQGLDPREARLEAERRFGDANQVRAQVRSVDRLRAPRRALSAATSRVVLDCARALRSAAPRPDDQLLFEYDYVNRFTLRIWGQTFTAAQLRNAKRNGAQFLDRVMPMGLLTENLPANGGLSGTRGTGRNGAGSVPTTGAPLVGTSPGWRKGGAFREGVFRVSTPVTQSTSPDLRSHAGLPPEADPP